MFVLESLIYRPKRNMEAAVHEGADSKIAARQSLMLTILVLGLMFLSSQQLLYWWLALIFIVTMVFVEGFFLVS